MTESRRRSLWRTFTWLLKWARQHPCNVHVLVPAMEAKWKTLPARQAGKSKKLPARAKICLPDLVDKCWYMFWISKFYININITPVSAVGSSKILRSRFSKAQSFICLSKVTCPAGQASLKSYLPGSTFACTGQAGRRLFPTLNERRVLTFGASCAWWEAKDMFQKNWDQASNTNLHGWRTSQKFIQNNADKIKSLWQPWHTFKIFRFLPLSNFTCCFHVALVYSTRNRTLSRQSILLVPSRIIRMRARVHVHVVLLHTQTTHHIEVRTRVRSRRLPCSTNNWQTNCPS